MKIGFFDSGIGGITVLNEALKILPDEEYIYYADTHNAPYGIKKKSVVRDYVFNAVEFIVRKGILALVIACNTATSITIRDLRKKYSFPVIGMEPAVKPALSHADNKKILVLATPLTIKENKYRNLVSKLDADNIVVSMALPELVEYAEKGIFKNGKIISFLKKKFQDYNLDEYGTIVLGCTHFLFYKRCFEEIIPENIDIIDGNYGTVLHLKNTLIKNELINNMYYGQKIIFYFSGKFDNKRGERYLNYYNNTL